VTTVAPLIMNDLPALRPLNFEPGLAVQCFSALESLTTSAAFTSPLHVIGEEIESSFCCFRGHG